MATTLQLQPIALAAVLLLLLGKPASAQQRQQQPSAPVTLPGCRGSCGNITVPYPFGIGAGCYRDNFELVCDDSSSPPRLITTSDDVRDNQLAALSLAAGEARTYLNATRFCHNSAGEFVSKNDYHYDHTSFGGSPYRFLFSADKNRLVALGCPNLGYFNDVSEYYVSGCMSVCRPSQQALPTPGPGPCTGVGCCQSAIPRGIWYYQPAQHDFKDDVANQFEGNSTACRYTFLVDVEWFGSEGVSINRTDDFTVPVVLDWAIRNVHNCSAASRNATDYACRSAHSECTQSTNGPGYRCNCSNGYEGNPYLDGADAQT